MQARHVRMKDLSLAGLVGLVAGVGVLAALSVRAFEASVEGLFEWGYQEFPAMLAERGIPGWTAFLLYPFVLGLLVAGVKMLVPRNDRHHSIPLVIISMAKRSGKLAPVTTFLKTVGSVLTLGAGGSLGREGPVVLLGSGVGSAVGQALAVGPDWMNTLVAAGAGSAIATAFHAPMTGVFFAMEIVLIQFSARSFALMALACVTAAQASRLLVGAPSFPIPAYTMNSPWEIPLFLGLGLLIAPLARLYINVIYGSEHLGSKIKWLPAWIKPALGGILFGAVAIFLPKTLGGGYPTITEALYGQLPLALLVGLLVAKLITIGLTSGSGWPGGVFTPALFLGAMAGGTFGAVAHLAAPGLVTTPGAYAVVGMAAMIAGATQAPLTAMTLIFEVTRDYRIALPAMVACGVAAVFSHRLSPYSIDTLHLPEHGVLLPWQFHDLRNVTVDEAMTRVVHTVSTEMTLRDVVTTMQHHGHGGYPVVDEAGGLAGMITLRDIRNTPLEGRLDTPVTDVMTRDVATLTPSETLADAALLMTRKHVGRLPVVAENRLVGIVSRSDVLRAYPNAIDEEGFLER